MAYSKSDKARDAYYRRRYGISLAQYNQLRRKQNYSCAVCKKHESNFKTNLHVDHDHKTLEIRGLLCYTCNHRVVGRSRTGEILRAAADYLDGLHTGWFVPVTKVRRKKRRKKR